MYKVILFIKRGKTMVKLIKITHLGAIVFTVLFASIQIDAKHYNKEKRDECRAVSDSCRKVINIASRCKEICDVLKKGQSANYSEDKRICIARCRETILVCEDCVVWCKTHLQGLERRRERTLMNHCINKCNDCIQACEHTIQECHVENNKRECMHACRKSSRRLSKCIEVCREVAVEENAEKVPCVIDETYEIEECE